ncbi:MAG: DUF4157 domain-containing protein [Phormidium sp.]
MRTGQHTQKTDSSNPLRTPVTSMFESRPFAVQAQPEIATPENQNSEEQREKTQQENNLLSQVQISPRLVVQPKLKIGTEADHKYEQKGELQRKSLPNSLQRHKTEEDELQRKTQPDLIQCHGVHEEELQRKSLLQRHKTEEDELQRKAFLQRSGDGSFNASSDVENRINSSSNGGALPDNVRSFMEPRFGYSFENIRVHTDNTAVQLNQDLQAQAFTHGNDIYFGKGKSPQNLDLTAHELTHTIQQTGGVQLKPEATSHRTDCSCSNCVPARVNLQRKLAYNPTTRVQNLAGETLISRVQKGDRLSLQRHSVDHAHGAGCCCSSCQPVLRIQRREDNHTHSSGCHCSLCSGKKIQTQLVVGAPKDKYEQEADRVAAQVMRMPQTKQLNAVQRHEEKEKVQAKSLYSGIRINHLQRESIDNPVKVQHNAPNLIQRHASSEHYMLGQIAPDKLANISYIREVKSVENSLKNDPNLDYYADGRMSKKINDARTKKEEAKHTLGQEINRLLIFKDNPEALKFEETGKVKQGTDLSWQVPYVSLPVKDENGNPGGTSIVVTYSEINTLPDFFGNPETIANTPKKDVLAILQGVRQQSYVELNKLYTELFEEDLSVLHRSILPEKDFEGATGQRDQTSTLAKKLAEAGAESHTNAGSQSYFAAIERNACHFAPYSWDSWQKYHEQARSLAEKSREARENGNDQQARQLANQALLQNAFGEHYLQDAFAAGHLIDKTRIMQEFTKWMGNNGKNMGTSADAEARWAMASMIANKDLKSNPQDLDDMMMRQQGKEKGFISNAANSAGLGATEEIIFMMWWRNEAFNEDKKHLTPAEVAKEAKVEPQSVKGNSERAKNLMDLLVKMGFAKKATEGIFWQKEVYSIKQSQVDALKETENLKDKITTDKSAYKSTVGQEAIKKGGKRDFVKEAEEFNLASYNAFLSNAYIQAASGFFHDKFCREGLNVITGCNDDIGRIYGDENMMTAGAQKGVEYSARTSQMSRESIFNIIDGKPAVAETKDIRSRFPTHVKVGSKNVSLVDWQNNLIHGTDIFQEAYNAGTSAHALYKLAPGDGLSRGNALDVAGFAKHDGDVF